MTKKMTMLAVIGLLAAAGSLQAKGMGAGGGPGGAAGWHGRGGGAHKFGKRMIVHLRNRLSEKLDLNAAQEKKAQEILEAKSEKLKALMEETREKALAIRNEGVAELKAHLDKDQAAKLDRLAERMDRRREERRSRWLGKGGKEDSGADDD